VLLTLTVVDETRMLKETLVDTVACENAIGLISRVRASGSLLSSIIAG
jgi:hypothetical protein